MVGSSPAPSAARLPKGYRNDRYFGLIYDSVPSGADDLTIIPGIATREAVTLNRMGIYFVPQIATWRHHHVVAFAAELQIPPTQIVSERWVENAQSLCAEPLVAQTSAPPAPFLRTLAILTCAMMIGLFLVYFMGNRTATPLHGVLSADITAIRVPADSKLLASHVKAGDEVFSSTPLLTLEKVSHQKLIQDQQSRVQQLQNELRQAEAQSELELAWRSRELERELYDVRVQTQIIQEVQKQSRPSVPTAALEEPPVEHSGSNRTRLASVSRSRDVAQRAAIPAGGIVFFSGASGESTMESGLSAASVGLPPRPVPTQVAQARPVQLAEPKIVSAASPATTVASSAMAENLEARINRLESLRSVLPEQVRQAAGIENMRARLQDATALLDQMKEVSREVSVTSPGYGVVGQVRFREGDNLPEGEVMLKILHTDRRYVVVYVPTRRVNELQPGSEVKLSFPGGQQFRGQVTDLPMLAESLTPAGESLVAVRIDPVGRLWPHVPIGSQVDVAAVN
ncbi:MAG: efflux RND transporter periplasmic adaptor subunit [Planctomycetaceae bacterium]